MKPPYDLVLLVTAVAWAAALVFVAAAVVLLRRRLAPEASWSATRLLLPLVDLFGLYAGTLGLLALFLGRRGFSLAWGGSITLYALMIAMTMYDRAVLVPFLESAHKRLSAGEPGAGWREDWRFLRRLCTGVHAGVFGGAVAVAVWAATM